MKCWFGRLLTITCLLFVATNVRADAIQWSYAWSRNPVSVPSDGNGTGGISLTLSPSNGNSDITAVNLSTFSSAPLGTTDHFTHAPFKLGLSITDKASGNSDTTSFSGVFDGTLTPTSAGITATFDQTPHKLTIGKHLFTVALTKYTAPGIPDSPTVGSIMAHLTAADATGGGLPTGGGGGGGIINLNDVPEPATQRPCSKGLAPTPG
jgi:hypothetical protein